MSGMIWGYEVAVGENPSPRARFNSLVEDSGFEVTGVSTDGWIQSFTRADGLHFWRVANSRMGVGIQTARLVDGKFADHRPFYRGDNEKSLLAAMKRGVE